MSKTLNRRTMLQGAAVLPVLNFQMLPRRAAADETRSDDLKVLWLRRRELIARSDELDRLWLERRFQIPEWCLPGPKFRDRDGNSEGPIVGWPEAKGNPVPVENGRLLLRPSPMDLRYLFHEEVDAGSVENAGALYAERSKLLRSRLHERRALIAKIGLPKSSDWRAIDVGIEAVERAIIDLPPNPDATVARLMIAFRNRRIVSATGNRDELDHLRISLIAVFTGQTPNLSEFILNALRSELTRAP